MEVLSFWEAVFNTIWRGESITPEVLMVAREVPLLLPVSNHDGPVDPAA